MSTINFESLPAVEHGDYGWVLSRDPDTGLLSIMLYDDDGDLCVCGDDECEEWLGEDGVLIETDGHAQLDVAICYPTFEDLIAPTARCYLLPFEELRALPPGLTERKLASRSRSDKDGWVYAVALAPELSFGRLKIGFTAQPIELRLKSFRTSNPTAMLVGLWEADASDESRTHAIVPNRIGRSEVFDCEDLGAVLLAIDKLLGVPP